MVMDWSMAIQHHAHCIHNARQLESFVEHVAYRLLLLDRAYRRQIWSSSFVLRLAPKIQTKTIKIYSIQSSAASKLIFERSTETRLNTLFKAR